jgi:hypothetical protein
VEKVDILRIGANAHRLVGVFVLAVFLGGCSMLVPQTSALRDAKPEALPERVKLEHLPFFPQDEYQCGPAALAIALAGARVDVTPDALTREVYLPGRQGSLQADMLAAPRRHGVVGYRLAPRLADVLREVAEGLPVVVLQEYGAWPVSAWHYAVVVGYDYAAGEVMLHSGEKAWMKMPFAVFEFLWRGSDYWAMVASPPWRLPATAEESSYLAAIAALEASGDPQAANAAYAAFLGRWPGNGTAIIGVANTHHALGELGQAEAVLRSAAVRHPESVIVLNNLAQTLADLGRASEAALFIERAAALGGPFAATVAETRTDILRRLKAIR